MIPRSSLLHELFGPKTDPSNPTDKKMAKSPSHAPNIAPLRRQSSSAQQPNANGVLRADALIQQHRLQNPVLPGHNNENQRSAVLLAFTRAHLALYAAAIFRGALCREPASQADSRLSQPEPSLSPTM